MILQIILITLFIEMVLATLTALIFFALFNYVFIDPIRAIKEQLKSKTSQYIQSNFFLKKAFDIISK